MQGQGVSSVLPALWSRIYSDADQARAAYDKPEVRERFKGERSHLWKGGRKRTERGYIAVHCPGHPSIKFGARRSVLEHRLGIENLELWVGGHPPGQRVDEKA
jgi:hypothetical protein